MTWVNVGDDNWHELDDNGNILSVVYLPGEMTLDEYIVLRDNPPPVLRTVAKSVIVSRLIEAGKIEAAYAALNANPSAWARWVASDRPAINHDDPDAIALLVAIGADPAVILAA